eukprot:Protomagalhaensia_wolfi_Nauph_80__4277@NODE_4367_length_585_cov_1089_465201_g3486_i0_p1_GENE_NODE_4367_length_585_cov_1089_465201_g3486_i0NODE_4367_length_585_cov_1089_465201_g3486_i0_p1_ORF_typecomplete_len100_score28_07FAP/PF07174_11/0_0036Alpha_GJ/PF03229_13/10_NODE_4367_length_585_cov_1089_465201_g3486_i0113412
MKLFTFLFFALVALAQEGESELNLSTEEPNVSSGVGSEAPHETADVTTPPPSQEADSTAPTTTLDPSAPTTMPPAPESVDALVLGSATAVAVLLLQTLN